MLRNRSFLCNKTGATVPGLSLTSILFITCRRWENGLLQRFLQLALEIVRFTRSGVITGLCGFGMTQL